MSKLTRIKAYRLGVFIILGLFLFVLAVYFIGSKKNLFTNTVHVKVSFKNIRGVMTGNKVLFSGINVGHVKSINMISDTNILLDLSVKTEFAKYIYRNSVAEIGQEGLMGSKVVIISGGTPSAGVVNYGDVLFAKEGIDIENMLVIAKEILTETKTAVGNIKEITHKINYGDGDIARALNNKQITQELELVLVNLNSLSEKSKQIVNKINNGEGDFSKLLNNNDLTSSANLAITKLDKAGQSADSLILELNKVTKSINEGEGVVTKLLNDKKLANQIDTTMNNIDESIKQITTAAKTIESSWIFNVFSKKRNQNKQIDTVNKK